MIGCGCLPRYACGVTIATIGEPPTRTWRGVEGMKGRDEELQVTR